MLDSIFLFSYNEQVSHKLWPHGQSVKTSPFHGGVRGSTPLEATKKNDGVILLRFFCYIFNREESNPVIRAPENHKIFGKRNKQANRHKFAKTLHERCL